ncbi:MAG: DUF5615 family PIN-like protein [Hormoscilla sp. GUM202]|nr:DUF5615 family PIN-like protein [Hormoscilla sp. GUM202]
MSQICLYFDEDAGNRSLIEALQNSAVDAMTTQDANRLRSDDEEQLIWATARVIYSFNMGDFCRLHKMYLEQGREHAGIILASKQSYSIGQQLRGLLRLMADRSAEDMRNQLVFLSAYIRDE